MIIKCIIIYTWKTCFSEATYIKIISECFICESHLSKLIYERNIHWPTKYLKIKNTGKYIVLFTFYEPVSPVDPTPTNDDWGKEGGEDSSSLMVSELDLVLYKEMNVLRVQCSWGHIQHWGLEWNFYQCFPKTSTKVIQEKISPACFVKKIERKCTAILTCKDLDIIITILIIRKKVYKLKTSDFEKNCFYC